MKIALSMSASHRPGREMDFLRHTYFPFLEPLGFVPVVVPNMVADPAAYVTTLGVEGVILTGGGDIDPARYRQPVTDGREVSLLRDTTEGRLVEAALEHGWPVLGICRGMQFINVYFGGALVQDIPSQVGAAVDHDESEHPVAVIDPVIAGWLGAQTFDVNTHHHQAVLADRLAPDLVAFARSEPDGVIEGVYHRQRPVLGVQWHPERPGPSRTTDRRLIRALFTEGMFWDERHAEIP
jgi:gamma-glutamyl-gamma-aminobutyrate hydrolase PuuD